MKKYILPIFFTCVSIVLLSAGNKYDKVDVHRRDKGKNGVAIVVLDKNYGLVDSLENEILAPVFESVNYLDDDLIIAGKNKKYGLFNTRGISVLPIEYDGVYFLKKGFYTLTKDGKIGVFSLKDQKVTVPVMYDLIMGEDYGVDTRWLQNSAVYKEKRIAKAKSRELLKYNSAVVYLDKKIALLDLDTGKEIIPLGKYDRLEPSDKYGYIVVSKGEDYGVVNYSGQEIVPLSESSLTASEFGFIIGTDNKQGFISLEGVKLAKYDGVLFFENGVAVVSLEKKYGAINYKGKEIIPPEYDQIYIEDSYIYVMKEESYDSGKTYIKDLDGKDIFPALKYDNIQYYPESHLAIVEEESKYGIINEKGKKLLPIKYDRVYFSSGQKLARIEINNKWGIADEKGKILVQPKYDGISEFKDGVTEIGYYSEQGNKIGLLDVKGNEVLKPQFSSMFFYWDKPDWNYDNRYALVYLENKVGMITREGKVTVSPQYDEIIYQDRYKDDWNGIAITKQNKRFGLVNVKTGEVIFSPENEYIYTLGNGESILFFIRKDGKQAIVDSNGKIVRSFSTDFVQGLTSDNKYLKKTVNGKLGVIDKDFSEVVPCVYDYIGVIKSNYLLVKLDNRFGIIDFNNNSIIPLEYDNIQYCQPLQQIIAKKDNMIGFLFLERDEFMPSDVAERYYKK
jgi:hypothetical protein